MSTLKVNAIEKKDADQTLTVKDATLTGATITTGTFPAGVIIQVVQNTVSTEKTDSSNTWVADDLYVNITPFKASSKILVILNVASVISLYLDHKFSCLQK